MIFLSFPDTAQSPEAWEKQAQKPSRRKADCFHTPNLKTLLPVGEVFYVISIQDYREKYSFKRENIYLPIFRIFSFHLPVH
jgi:hypothetical protein